MEDSTTLRILFGIAKQNDTKKSIYLFAGVSTFNRTQTLNLRQSLGEYQRRACILYYVCCVFLTYSTSQTAVRGFIGSHIFMRESINLLVILKKDQGKEAESS